MARVDFDPDKHTCRYACGNVPMLNDIVVCVGEKAHKVKIVNDVSYNTTDNRSYLYFNKAARSAGGGAEFNLYRLVLRLATEETDIVPMSKETAINALSLCMSKITEFEEIKNKLTKNSVIQVGIPGKALYFPGLRSTKHIIAVFEDEIDTINTIVLRLFEQIAQEITGFAGKKNDGKES